MDTLLFSSGMAALNVVFQALSFLTDEQLSLAAYASYFETQSLLRIGPYARCHQLANSEQELAEIIKDENVGVVLIEPIHYQWELPNTDWTDILIALNQREHPPIMILDTTLSGACPTSNKLLEILRAVVPIIINLRSGIKLDQQGLELANLGVVELWSEAPQLTEKVALALRKCRSLCGATLSWNDACALAPEAVFSRASFCSYSESVAQTARHMYEALLAVGPLFASVSHPASPWFAPLIMLQLQEGGSDNYTELSTLLDEQQTRRDLSWQMSGSFGFRSHRFETILPEELQRRDNSHDGVLKIASGCYAGARHQGIIELLLELSHYPDLKTARIKMAKRNYSYGKQ
ncbi:TPA: hypothetical protein ACVOYK_004503 [Vibrio diabolicus]